jgi:hypothetical protein
MFAAERARVNGSGGLAFFVLDYLIEAMKSLFVHLKFKVGVPSNGFIELSREHAAELKRSFAGNPVGIRIPGYRIAHMRHPFI